MSCLDPNNKSSGTDFVDNGVSQKNELRRSCRVKTRKYIYDAESGKYKPVYTALYISVFIQLQTKLIVTLQWFRFFSLISLIFSTKNCIKVLKFF